MMRPDLSADIVMQSQTFTGIKAGIARLDDILSTPSYQAEPQVEKPFSLSKERTVTAWPSKAESVLVLGLHHPANNPRLDWGDRGNTLGNRRLMLISDRLKHWLYEVYGVSATPLPYHLEWGGLFLKDAAVLAGLGIIGRNNLLVNPNHGSHIRLRAILIEADLEPAGRIEGFDPCDDCDQPCLPACLQDAFLSGAFSRPECLDRINADIRSKMFAKGVDSDTRSRLVIKYCRDCELACPVGSG